MHDFLLAPADTDAPAIPRLIDRLAAEPGTAWVETDTLADFLAAPGQAVLFVWSDPIRYPECLDVAVVLPEIRRSLAAEAGVAPEALFRIGVVGLASERAIAEKQGALKRPSVVFVRDGGWQGVIGGMLDWSEFAAEARRLLATEPGRAPGIGIPVRNADACH
ncbi:hypothetical protein [Derxia gummosa]|uniref:Hydrogenase expression/formation protein n=1 Tax=Derxia gummosa DSM 723 TaxID=1121388 RepID=A0A8B6X0W4_9BURK|nr:hypothetical protein [Derxia gummosa]